MDVLMIQLEKDRNTPLYEQLYMAIKEAITIGKISMGERLPSKRKLAEYLGVSQTTTELAYSQLLAEGYITSQPRKGYYVQNIEELAFIEKEISPLSLDEITKSYAIDFSPGKIDLDAFPFTTWRKYAKDIMHEDNKELLQLGHPQGDIILRQQIATYLYQSRGVICTADQIILGSGTEQLMPLIIRLLGKNAFYAFEDPGYPLTHHLFLDENSVPISVDEEGIILTELEHSPASVMYVTPSHQFPTGAVLSASRRSQLLAWAYQKNNRYIIEDDYDSEFRYVGRPFPSLQGMDQNDRVIYLSTFSKSLMPSLRMAYAVLPGSLLKLYKERFSYYSATVPRIDQYILAKFMEDGHFAKHLNRMRKIYKRKLEIILHTLSQYAPLVKLSGEQAGMHLVLTINSTKTEQELVSLANDADIRIFGLSEYTSKKQTGSPQLLLGFGGIPTDQVSSSIHQLMNSIK